MAKDMFDYNIDNFSKNYGSLDAVRVKRRYKVYFTFAIGFTLFLFFSLGFLPWQQSAYSVGRVIAYAPNERQQVISAPVDGRIKQWHVFEGQTVKAGDPIVTLADNDPEIIERIRLQRDLLKQQVDVAKLAVKTAKSYLDRQISLFEKGLSSQKEVEVARLKYADYLAKEADVSAKLAQSDIKLARQNSQSVTAPFDGVILRVLVGEGGQIVKASTPLTSIVPMTDSRAVEVFINGNDMPLVSKGAPVRIQFEGWPALQFSGWPNASVGTFEGEIAFIDATDDGTGLFRAIVLQTGPDWPSREYLRQGVRAKAWILLGEVSLGYELWRIFNGFPPDMPHQKTSEKKTKK